MARTLDLGDGDVCPLDASHGKMYAIAKNRQWCSHTDHDGRPGTHKLGKSQRTRSFWPLYGIEAEIAKANLPNLDEMEMEF